MSQKILSYIKNSYFRKIDKRYVYQFTESYKNDNNQQIIVAKIIDSPRGIIKMPAIELVTKRRDILCGFSPDDIINIVGIATTEKSVHVTQRQPSAYKYFAFIAMLFCATLLTANIASSKLIAVFGLTMTGGTLSYPMAYILGDIITEVYGYKRARQLIWGAIICNLFLVFFIYLTIHTPPSVYWHNQKEYALILGSVPRVVIASLVSYWAGEFINSYIIAKIKILYNGKTLWKRIIGASIFGITTDTTLFVLIAYTGIIPLNEMIPFAIRVYLFKLFYEAMLIPVTMWVINKIKVNEVLDIIDINTNFTPFSLDVGYKTENNLMKACIPAISNDIIDASDIIYHPGNLVK